MILHLPLQTTSKSPVAQCLVNSIVCGFSRDNVRHGLRTSTSASSLSRQLTTTSILHQPCLALPIEEYQVGWVCALPKELTAARAMLDEEHESIPRQEQNDDNSYVLGRIHGHNTVIACLPAGVYGTVSAAGVALNMLRTFKGIRFGFLVGIGGGIPHSTQRGDIRLGDVVVSQPDGIHGGVVQYDLRKNLGHGVFERKGFLQSPPKTLLTALSNLQSRHLIEGNQISKTISAILKQHPQLAKVGYIHPGQERDLLSCSNINHEREPSCAQCYNGIVIRKARENSGPVVHYGIIASGNELVKNSIDRDRLGRELGAKCVEMEAAGLMNDFPCIVVRGIADYADAEKNDMWQEYAALVAAAFTKELLSVVRPVEVKAIQQASEAIKYHYGLNLFDAPDLKEDLFIGRQNEIQEIVSTLQPFSATLGSKRNVLVLGGTGGIGKTQLAIAYAKRYESYYTSIFWLNATSEVTLKASIRDLANCILPSEALSQLDDEHILIRVSAWLSNHDNQRWLLIFDNYDEQDMYQIRSYYPFRAHGSMIVTTRQPDRVNGARIRLRHLDSIDDSLRVLATRSGREDIQSDPEARRLAARLDGHPLALATAGAYLCQSTVTCGEFLQQYEAKWKVIESMEELADYPLRTLFTTWDMSFKIVQQQNLNAANLLRLLAYLDNHDVRYELFHGMCGEGRPVWFNDIMREKFAFEEAIRVLIRYCLVDTNQQASSYRLHPCVHDWTLDGLNRPIDPELYWLAFDCVTSHLPLLEELAIMEKQSDLQLVAPFKGHLRRLAHSRFDGVRSETIAFRERIDPMERAAMIICREDIDAARNIYQLLAAEAETLFGATHPSTIRIMLVFVRLTATEAPSEGSVHKAQRILRSILDKLEMKAGPEDPWTIAVMDLLASLYSTTKQLDQAEMMTKEVLEGYEKLPTDFPFRIADLWRRLAGIKYFQGKLDEAKAMYLRVLELAGIRGLEDHTVFGTTLTLGVVYRNEGDLKHAEDMFRRALGISDRVPGPEGLFTMFARMNLANILSEQGKPGQAQELYEQVRMQSQAGYQQHVRQVEHVVSINEGVLYAQLGHVHVARLKFEGAHAGLQAGIQPSSLFVNLALYNLGQLEQSAARNGAIDTTLSRRGVADETGHSQFRSFYYSTLGTNPDTLKT
ncbi:hypothetical protein LTR84_009914 [Exophiala bonariae]|uniref:Nucleoside phosphorylase domain-containing protein n=1 Tax=Exophiala bonariae TaxID=1690606 RepID=A0AAV9NNA1_9EURO|nr:hypothetical protein LTR84_009914 [Exophiala bonariae]